MGTHPLGDPSTLPALSFQHSLVVLPLLPPWARCWSSHVPRQHGLHSLRERRVFGINSSILGFPGATCPCVLLALLTEQEGAHAQGRCLTNPHTSQTSRLDGAFKAPSSSSSACNPLQTGWQTGLTSTSPNPTELLPPITKGKMENRNCKPEPTSKEPNTSDLSVTTVAPQASLSTLQTSSSSHVNSETY